MIAAKRMRMTLARLFIFLLAVLEATFGIAALPASAEVGPHQTHRVELHLTEHPSITMLNRYSDFINNIRDTVRARGSAFPETTRRNEGLIEAILVLPNTERVSIFINPGNLYVVGYTTSRANRTWRFSDQNFNDVSTPNQRSLGYGGTYISLETQAHRGRERIPISHGAVYGAVRTLVNLGTSAPHNAPAQPLQTLIAAISEAVRFYDIYGVYAAAMNNHPRTTPGWVVELENAWGHLSDLSHDLDNGHPGTWVRIESPTTHRNVTITTQAQIRRYVAIRQGSGAGG